ncbi:MAG: DinB family protein [Candidatus Acidiferrales bacterium]
MKNRPRSTFLFAALILFAFTATARAQDGGAQSKTPPPPKKAVLDNWNDVGNRLVTMAQDWPEDKYTYKLTPQVRTVQQVFLHIAGSNYDMINRLSGSKVGLAANDPPVSEYKTKAEVVAYLKKSVEDGAALAEKEGDAGVMKNLNDWIGYTEHMGEHYGLMVAYYRANNTVPPESRPKK